MKVFPHRHDGSTMARKGNQYCFTSLSQLGVAGANPPNTPIESTPLPVIHNIFFTAEQRQINDNAPI